MLSDGAPLADRALDLEGRRYPFESAFAPLDHTTTAADGTYAFERMLDRNWQFRITDAAAGVTSKRVRAYVFPFTTLTFRARNSRVIKLTQRYRVPKGVKLDQPTLFYVGKRGRKTAPRVASGKLERDPLRPLHVERGGAPAQGLERPLPLRELLPVHGRQRHGQPARELPVEVPLLVSGH